MKVKLFTQICCPDGVFQAGDEPDLEDATAKGLLDGDYAEHIEPPKKDGEKIETKNNNSTSDRTYNTSGSKKPSTDKRK